MIIMENNHDLRNTNGLFSLEKKHLDQKILLRGYTPYTSNFFNSKEYKNMRNCILDDLPEYSQQSNVTPLTEKEFNKACNEIILQHVDKDNLIVPYADGLDLEQVFQIYAYTHRDGEDILDFLSLIYSIIQNKPITDIDIHTSAGNQDKGNVSIVEYNQVIKTTDYYKVLPLIITGINVEGILSNYSTCIGVHEKYHGLTLRQKGYTDNYLYEELISIFMEQVAAEDISNNNPEFIENNILKRLSYLKGDILLYEQLNHFNCDALEKIDAEKYILSTTIALQLYDIYRNASAEGKKEIDKNINSILNGDIQIEDVLNKYDITETESSEFIKQKVKSL